MIEREEKVDKTDGKNMIILGIDPGIATLGYGVIEKDTPVGDHYTN